MNINIIQILSTYLCFTLEMTKISGLVIETEVLNAISSLDTIITVESFISDKTHRASFLLEALRDEAVKMSLGVSHQVQEADTEAKEFIMDVLKSLQIVKVSEITEIISRDLRSFGKSLNDNIENSNFMVEYLDSFIKTYRNHDYERTLIDYLDSAVIESKSLIKIIIEYLQHNQQENSNKMRTTTNKLVHEIYTSMMLAVGKGQSFLELCYKVKDFYSGGLLNVE